MRQYVGLVFDDWVSGLGTVFSPSFLDTQLGEFEQLAIQVIATRVGGSSPRLNAMLQHSSNGRHWFDKSATPAIESANLTAAQTNVLVGADTSGVPTLAYARWMIRLEGTAPRAYVKLWVTARGKRPADAAEQASEPRSSPPVWRTAGRETGVLFRVAGGPAKPLTRETPADRIEGRAPEPEGGAR